MAHSPIIVVEDDPFTHLIPIILDPKSSTDRQQAFSDFMGRTTKAILRETERWKALIAKTGIKAQQKIESREVTMLTKLLAATAIAIIGCFGSLASAQSLPENYPDRTLRIVVPFAAGGGVDVLTRIIAQRLSVLYGKPAIVENQVGATGLNAVQYVGTAPNDGYTLLVGAPTPFSVLPALRTNLPYNNLSDFIPITLFGTAPGALTINPAVPANTIPELIAHLKANPGKLSFGNTGPGGLPHLSVELFTQLSGTKVVHVPYRGTAPALSDVIAGHIHGVIDALISQLPAIQQGQVRVLGVSLKQRSPLLPDVPTIDEFLPGYESVSWIGMFAAPGTSPEIVKKLHADVRRVIEEPEVRQRMLSHAITPDGRPPEAFRSFINVDIERWRNVGKTGQIKIE